MDRFSLRCRTANLFEATVLKFAMIDIDGR